MLGREGHGRTEAIKMKSSQAAPYKPQSHPLSAGISFPTSHLFPLGQGQCRQCRHWKLEIRVFPGITFHQQELRLFPSFPVKQGLCRPIKARTICVSQKERDETGRRSSWKAFKAKAEEVWLLDFQELFQEVLEAPVLLAELQENSAGTFWWGTTKKPLLWKKYCSSSNEHRTFSTVQGY